MILTTPRLRLRPMEPTDIETFIRYLNDWEVQQWLITPPFPYTRANGEYFLDLVARDHAGPWPTRYVIADKGDDSVLGVVSIDLREEKSGELGYWLGRDRWGRGLTKEAVAALVEHARRHPTLRALWATTDPANLRSQQVLLSCGFNDCGLRDRDQPTRRGATQLRHYEMAVAPEGA